jgi:ADP-ribosylation factor protein 6
MKIEKICVVFEGSYKQKSAMDSEGPPVRIFKILILGLEGTGKTSIARSLALKPQEAIYKPTIGVNFYKTIYKNTCLVFWDLGGLEQFRKLWRIFFPGTDGILYVLDGRKYDDAIQSLQVLTKITQHLPKPVVLLINKQDHPGALSVEAIEAVLKNHEITVVGTSVLANQGITEAISCLFDKINKAIENISPFAEKVIEQKTSKSKKNRN